MLLSQTPDHSFFEEWMESFFARDIQELFGVRNRLGFLSLLKLLIVRSGGRLNVVDLAKETGLSRPTVISHLDALEIAHSITRVPPYHAGGHREIIKQPKVYAFDTGMVAHVRGWDAVRETDRGFLWEHLVLDELRFINPASTIHYWRDKRGHEVDFVIEGSEGRVDTIEAKINPDSFNSRNLMVFRQCYPKGMDYLLCPYVREPYKLKREARSVTVCGVEHLSPTVGGG
jgi:predicted AAA+ superfamily ATPase